MELSVFSNSLNTPPVPEGNIGKPPMKGWKKILIGISILVLLILAIVFLGPRTLSTFWGKDDMLVNDSDLRPGKVVIKDTDNAYIILAAIKDSDIYRGENNFALQYTSGKVPWNEAQAIDVITKNGKVLNQFTLASEKKYFQIPVFADPLTIKIDGELPYLNTWRNISQISAVKAEYLARKGDTPKAIEEAEKSVWLGQRIQNSQGNILVYLVGASIKNTGLVAFRSIAFASDKKFADSLLEYVSRLNMYAENSENLKRAFKVEYALQLDAIQRIKQGTAKDFKNFAGEDIQRPGVFVDNNFYFKPNQTQNKLYEQYKNIIAQTDGCNNKESATREPFSFVKALMTENAIGKVVLNATAVAYDSVLSRRCLQNVLLDATRLTLALRVYDMYKADAPKNLSVLIPDYIDAIPKDPFINASLVYSEQRRIIYSVGPDGWDTGGDTTTNWQTASDPTFSVDFSKKVR